MLVGRPPFETNNIKTTYRKIKLNDYKIPAGLVSDVRLFECIASPQSSFPCLPICYPVLFWCLFSLHPPLINEGCLQPYPGCS